MFFKKPKSSGFTAEIRVRRCYGCGAILQDQDPQEVGYVPPEKFASEDEMLCERCYKLRHYSSYSQSPSFNVDYVTILSHAKEEDALAVYVLNAFCLDGSFLDGIGKYLPQNVLVVVNKRDCLPDSYSDDYLIALVKAHLAKEGIHPKDVLLTSASTTNSSNMDKVMDRISQLRMGKSVYFFGAYQVGKSSIINSLLMDYSNSTEKMITTSPYPGTTLDVISIPLDDNSYLYDTPGIYNQHSFVSFIEPELVKYVLPRTLVRPEGYQAKEGQSFIISDFFRLDFVSGDKTDFTFFKSNDLEIVRCKIQKADSMIKANAEDVSLDIRSQKIHSVADLIPTTFKATPNRINTLRVWGLCFAEFMGKDQSLTVYAPKDVSVSLESDLDE
jgi:ribosome biogenesis GTPase YqeH